MAGEHALPDLITRIRVDSSGVDAAMSSLIHSFGKADLALAGVAAGIGLLVLGAKSAIDITMKHEDAESNLAQALALRTKATTGAVNVSRDLGKQSDALAAATRRLQEFDAAHQTTITSKTSSTKGATAATAALETASRRLDEFDVAHHGHKLTAIQLMQREDLANRVAVATARLAAAEKAAGQVTTTVHGLSAAQLMHRRDLLNQVAKAQAALRAAEAAEAQAQKTEAINAQAMNDFLETFIKTNRRYLSSQDDVINGAATLLRAGVSQKEIQLDLNRAVDLAALKHISYSEAIDLLNQAEHGRLRGLIDLGIATTKYTDANGNLVNGTKDVSKAMGELDGKLAGGRDTLSHIQQESNLVKNDWEDLANKAGPPLLDLLDKVITKVDEAYTALDNFGKDNEAWAGINSHLVGIAQAIHDNLIFPLQAVWDAYSGQKLPPSPIAKKPPQSVGNSAGNSGSKAPDGGYYYNGGAPSNPNIPSDTSGSSGRQFGGPVIPGRMYHVGEAEEETLVMYPGGGGAVIPSHTGRRSSGGDTINNFHQVMANPWDIANELVWAKKTKRL